MSELISNSEMEVAQTVAIIEDQLRSGFLYDIASAKVELLPDKITANEIAEIILPEPKGNEVLPPRWILIDKAEAVESTKSILSNNSEALFDIAQSLNLRKILNNERLEEDIYKIDPEKAIFIVEGGANKTSVVRRGVAIRAMHALYGENLASQTLFQFGSGRIIPQFREITKPDGTKETIVNAEHKIIIDLAGEFLPGQSEFTEFEANVATARADGYILTPNQESNKDDLVSRRVELIHSDYSRPKLVLIQPKDNTLESGFDSLKSISQGRQFVTSTNGQYREKVRYQAELWKVKNGIDMLPTVSLGDEPGDSFHFRDYEIVVPKRPESAYLNELIILRRSGLKIVPNYS